MERNLLKMQLLFPAVFQAEEMPAQIDLLEVYMQNATHDREV